jgi:hypothetical protein
VRCRDARGEEANSDDLLAELLPRIKREIDEELRPLVLHAFDGHPSAGSTGEAGDDRQAEPRYHGHTASRRRGGRGRDR